MPSRPAAAKPPTLYHGQPQQRHTFLGHLKDHMVASMELQVATGRSMGLLDHDSWIRKQSQHLPPIGYDESVVVETISQMDISKTPISWPKIRLALTLIIYSGFLGSVASFPTPGLDSRMFPAPLFSACIKSLIYLFLLRRLNTNSGTRLMDLFAVPNISLTYSTKLVSTILGCYLKPIINPGVPKMIRWTLQSTQPIKVYMYECRDTYNLVAYALSGFGLSLVLGAEADLSNLVAIGQFWILVIVNVLLVLINRAHPSGLAWPLGNLANNLVTVIFSLLLVTIYGQMILPPNIFAWGFLVLSPAVGVYADLHAMKACCLVPQHGDMFWAIRDTVATIVSLIIYMIINWIFPEQLSLLGLLIQQAVLLMLAFKPIFQGELMALFGWISDRSLGRSPIPVA